MESRHRYSHLNFISLALLSSVTIMISACGGGGGGAPPPTPTSHAVDITWNSSKEAAVNSLGGGYKVAISGQPVIDVPFPYSASGLVATTTLMSGNYNVTVTAYSATNPSTGLAASGVGSSSLPSSSFAIFVPY